jgi:hypothetical protein
MTLDRTGYRPSVSVNRRTMKAIFVTASICSVASLVGVVGLSAMSIVPSPGAESWRWRMMLAAAAFLVGWLGLAIWARRLMRPSVGTAALPSWLARTIVVAGAFYVLVVLLFTVG